MNTSHATLIRCDDCGRYVRTDAEPEACRCPQCHAPLKSARLVAIARRQSRPAMPAVRVRRGEGQYGR